MSTMRRKLMRRKLTAALVALAFVVTPFGAQHSRAITRAQAAARAAAVAAHRDVADAAQREAGTRSPAAVRGFTQYVDTFVGTDNDGNTFPGATVPFAMVPGRPDTP